MAHSPAKVRESAGFVPDNGFAGRPKLPKPMDLARQLVERHATALLRPHFKALGLMLHDDGSTTLLEGGGAVVVHQGEATSIEDLGAQISAARELLDRVYGKPRQSPVLTGADGGPVEVVVEARQRAEAMSREELDAFLLGADTADGLAERERLEQD